MNKRNLLSMRVICLLIGLIPIIVLGVISLSYTHYELKETVYIEIEDKLEAIADCVTNYSLQDYEVNNDIVYSHDFIDVFKEQNIDVTIIKDNTRYISTLRKSNGDRNEGSKIDTEVYQSLLSGKTYQSNDLVIDNVDYMIYYEPIIISGQYWGAVAVMQPLDAINNSIESTFRNNILLIGGSLVFFCILLIFISNLVATPLRESADLLEIIADGDLTSNVKINSICKETVSIISAIELVNSNLLNIITNVRNDTKLLDEKNSAFNERFNFISDNVQSVNVAIEEIALGNSSQANDISSIASQVSDLSDIVISSESEIETLSSSVKHMNNVSSVADSSLGNLVKLNQKAKENIEIVVKQTNSTNMSAEKIQEAVSIIKEIANQTNLLSLNASIEAARAGDQGRGFAVVADEIRKLANNSADSAVTIECAVKELLENSSDSVNTMNNVLESSSKEYEALVETSSAFDALKSEISNVQQVSIGVANQINKLGDIRLAITDATEGLSAVSEENAAASQETSASMQELSANIESCTQDVEVLQKLSLELNEQVKEFNI